MKNSVDFSYANEKDIYNLFSQFHVKNVNLKKSLGSDAKYLLFDLEFSVVSYSKYRGKLISFMGLPFNPNTGEFCITDFFSGFYIPVFDYYKYLSEKGVVLNIPYFKYCLERLKLLDIGVEEFFDNILQNKCLEDDAPLIKKYLLKDGTIKSDFESAKGLSDRTKSITNVIRNFFSLEIFDYEGDNTHIRRYFKNLNREELYVLKVMLTSVYLFSPVIEYGKEGFGMGIATFSVLILPFYIYLLKSFNDDLAKAYVEAGSVYDFLEYLNKDDVFYDFIEEGNVHGINYLLKFLGIENRITGRVKMLLKSKEFAHLVDKAYNTLNNLFGTSDFSFSRLGKVSRFVESRVVEK